MDTPSAKENNNVFKAKKITLIQYSPRESHGIAEKITATTPVPMVVANPKYQYQYGYAIES